MGRMYGERPEEYQARRAFQVESAVATRAYEVEREIKRREGIPLPVFQVETACPCPAYPFAHLHSEEDQRRSKLRFDHRQPAPGSREREVA